MVCYKATWGWAGHFNTRKTCDILEQSQRKWNKVEQSAIFWQEITSIWMCQTTATTPTPSWTCLLSIVVSRPVQTASHRGVIQESLVCTARHPTHVEQPGVWQQYRIAKLSFSSQTYHDNTLDTICSCTSHTQPSPAIRELPPPIWQNQAYRIYQIADSDRSERHTKQSSQFQSEWTMRCFILMVCYKATTATRG